MPVNYSISKPAAGTSRATAPTETQIIADVSDTIADIDARLASVVQRANHTGTQTASTISDLTEAIQDAVGAMATDSATVDFTYDDTAGTLTATVQGLTAANVSDFAEAVDDRVAALLVAGTNVTLTYNDAAGTLTIDAATGGSGVTNLSWSAATSTVASDTGTDAVLTAVDGTNPGLMTVAQKSKLDGIEAAADVTDATNVAAAGAVMGSGVQYAVVAIGEATTSTSYADLTTSGPAVTVTVGSSGRVLVTLGAASWHDTSGNFTAMSVALSGANTAAANDTNIHAVVAASTSSGGDTSSTIMLTGLTPGSTTFTAKYRVASGTGNWSRRRLTVVPL
ncbi:MAG TPA: hypothetical protein VFK52_10725 [Nocardioidaceae bacterium]|nr:hypothetical protein [Nocardioidaceae bacterium]